jgi:hypothetical protein
LPTQQPRRSQQTTVTYLKGTNMNDNTAIEMFDALWSPGKHSLCAQVNGSPFKTVGLFDSPTELLDAASRLPETANIWWGVHGMDEVVRGRGGSDDVVAVTCLAADFDWADDSAHKGANLPSELEVRLAVSLMPEPTVVVNSGHGLQVYWGLVGDLGPDEGQRLSDGFFRWIEAEFGLHNDRTDLASVLRLPGSFNNKAEPVEVVIELNTKLGWDPEYLRQEYWLPALTVVPSIPNPPHPNALPVSALGGGGGFEDTGETPFDWLNRTFDSAACLIRMGWVFSHDRGSEAQFTRPGKDPRQGTSATLHTDTGAVNIYSTSLDPIYAQVGLQGRGCVTLKPADLWMVENGITDRSEASRQIRALMPQDTPRATARSTPGVPVQEVAVWQETSTDANLPDEFWAERGWLAHIRQAAHHRQLSADAILGAVIARYATIVPPNYVIPPIIMAASTFDHISVLVAESGGGKSAAMAIARELFPGPQERKDVVWDFPTPSGEGLVGGFFEMTEQEVNGKKTMVNTKTKTAVHFSVDEALGLVESSGRQGATIGSVLCTAWSGGNPGQGNASADRKRIGMNPWTYRMAGLAAIQLSLGHRLLEDTFVQQGLSGRLVFFAAEDPSIPHWSVRPAWPGPMDLPIHATMPLVMEYASSIEEEILEQNHQKQTKKVHVAPIDGHTNLVKLKLSGIFALMDGRTAVTESDWRLAGAVVASHLALRNRMLAVKKQANYERTVTAATAQATFEDVKDDVKERKSVARLRDAIIRKVPKDGITRAPLRRATTSSAGKHRFDAALTKALEDGKIELRGDRYYPA